MGDVDRVLATRLQATEFVLGRLSLLSADVTNARKGLDDLGRQVNALRRSLNAVNERASNLVTKMETWGSDMETYQRDHDESDLVSADDIGKGLEEAKTLRNDLQELSRQITRNTSNAISGLRRWSALSDATVKIDEKTRIKLENALKKAGIQPDPWGYFQSEIQDACDDLFAQYVDLLGGIALRDQGLDPVSRYADDLVTLLLRSFGESGALAVPSRHTGQALVQSHHIRLPLPPGWTLWSLPLVARGVGELLRSRALETIDDTELVPDIFGAFVLGPAYAHAALLLELDPRLVEDQRRAGAILRVLRLTDEGDDNRRFTALARQLGDEWGRATIAAGPADPATEDSVPEADAVYQHVRQHCEDAAYFARDTWDRVEKLSEDLRGSSGDAGAGGELRDVLNAMWLARWRHPDDLSAIEAGATAAVVQVKVSGHPPREPGASSPIQGNR